MVTLQPGWTLYGIAPGFALGAVLAATLAVVVYRARPERAQNRWLALLLFTEALSSACWAVLNAVHGPATAWASFVTGHAFFFATMAVYPLFLGTLETPLARPLRDWRVLGVIWTAVAGGLVLIIFRPELLLVGPVYVHGAVTVIYGPGARMLYTLVTVPVVLYALATVISVWRLAPRGSSLRARAGAFTIAFALRDSLLLLNHFGFTLLPLFFPPDLFVSQTGLLVMVWLYHLQIIAFPLIVGYGILKHQLFDIDLKIKWTIDRGTLVGVFVAVFFVAAQAAQAFLTSTYHWAIGGVAAGLLLLAINPVQRFASRVSDVAMPNVHDTKEYRLVRKREVYRAALEEMLADGVVTGKERRALVRLQEQLGLDATLAQHLEAEVLDTLHERKPA